MGTSDLQSFVGQPLGDFLDWARNEVLFFGGSTPSHSANGFNTVVYWNGRDTETSIKVHFEGYDQQFCRNMSEYRSQVIRRIEPPIWN